MTTRSNPVSEPQDVAHQDAELQDPQQQAATIRELERRLAEAQANLRALVAAQIDAVLESDQTTPLLLREAQAALQRSKAELEQVVAERTAELQDANIKLVEANRELAARNEALTKARLELEHELAERERAELELDQQRRVAEEAAAKAVEGKRILEALMEYIPEGITIADAPDVYIRMVSRFGEELTGRPRETIEGMPMSEHPERWQVYHLDGVTLSTPEELPLSRATLFGDVINDEEWILKRASGEKITILCNAGPIRDHKGEISGGVIAWRDITERKKVEEAIRAYTVQLERSNRDLEDFAFVASHDLQEPLRKVQAFGGQLKERYGRLLGEEGRDYLQRIEEATEGMQHMIEDLLAYSRIASMDPSFRRTDLNAVTREVLGDLEDRLAHSQGRVELGSLPVIDADPVQMRQLMQNLIGNALKFHRPETPPEVKVGVKASTAHRIELFVEDNGIGFDIRNLERIFQPFQRLHGRSEYGGNGIGLAICRRIVERHGGSITAESTPGEGATFFITLPVRQTAE
jgi:PAS domain S-box-containing protein